MLTPATVEELMAADPHNVVRIIQNKPDPGDKANRDRHVRAGKLLKRWIAEKAVVQDPVPAVYPYRHRFSLDNSAAAIERTGVIARVRLSEFGAGPIFPHENTLSAPKVDRFEHMEAINGNTEIVFGLVTDEGPVYDAMAACAQGDRAGLAVDGEGVEHELHVVADQERIRRLAEAAAAQQIIIADGHHRYETALRFHDQYRIEGSEYVIMDLVSMKDPGLVIRPFHRIIRVQPGVAASRMSDLLAGFFDLQEAGEASPSRVSELLASAMPFNAIFAPASGRRLVRLTLNAHGDRLLSGREMSAAWNHLNVSVINSVVVNTILGLPLDGSVLHEVVEYEKDPARALALAGDAAAFYGCFFIRPAAIEDVRAIVAGGERMPQKSTNFFPKCYSGLVFNLMGKS
jgi:uncharacterized protein (DUF1015 family)